MTQPPRMPKASRRVAWSMLRPIRSLRNGVRAVADVPVHAALVGLIEPVARLDRLGQPKPLAGKRPGPVPDVLDVPPQVLDPLDAHAVRPLVAQEIERRAPFGVFRQHDDAMIE